MADFILTYKGNPIADLTKDELVDALCDRVLAEYWARPNKPTPLFTLPQPSGEVAELVAWLESQIAMYEHALNRVLGPLDCAASPTCFPADRLPGPEDCDAEGRCWWGRAESDDWFAGWTLATSESVTEFCKFSPPVVWLPFNALPLPSGEVQA